MKIAPLLIITFIGLVSLMMQWSERRDLEVQISEARSREKLSSHSLGRSERESSNTSLKNSDLREKLREHLTSDSSFNTLTSILSNATADDIFPLIEEYRNELKTAFKEDRDNVSKLANVFQVLGVFHAELAPLKTLLAGDHLDTFKDDAFTALSRRSPEKAMEWLEASNLSSRQREGYLERYYKSQILGNPSKHLDAWRLHHRLDTSPVPILEPRLITDLLPKITEPENEDIRLSLTTSVLASSLLEGEGLARFRIESLGLEPEEIIYSLEASEDFACRETLDWAIDLGGDTPEKTIDLSEGLMAVFAQRDLNAAAEWLDKFQGHPAVKDQLTARYAMVLGSTDPEAAQPWIAKIQDEKERDSVFRDALYQWEENDPQSFAEWQKQQSAE